MSILKNQVKKNFTIIPNEIITDNRISKGALQIYLYLSSKPNNWKIHNSEIKKTLKIGSSNTLAKYWKELINSGWISRIRETNKQSQFTGSYNYTINTEIAKSDNSVKPKSQKNRNRKKTEIAKSDNYNNTDSINNTDLNNKKKLNKEKKSNKTPLSKDFKLNNETLERLNSEGYKMEQISKTIISFKDYWLEGDGKNKKKVNWQSTFRNWIRNKKPWNNKSFYQTKTSEDVLIDELILDKQKRMINGI